MSAALRTPAQNRAIWSRVASLEKAGLTRDDAEGVLRQVVAEVSGQEHTSQLGPGHAARVIEQLDAHLRRVAPRPQHQASAPHEPWGARGTQERGAARITPRQMEVLNHLYTDAGMTTLPQRVGFARRQLGGRARPETQADMDALIEPLKAMVLRKVGAEELLTRAKALVGQDGLDAWQVGFVADLCEQLQEDGKRAVTPHKLFKLIEAEAACSIRG